MWNFFTETFDLLSAGQFESLVFRPQSQGGQILDFQMQGCQLGQLVGGAIWIQKCWFPTANIDVWAHDRLFRVGEMRASVTKYVFFLFWSKWTTTAPPSFQGPFATPLEPLIVSSVWGKLDDCTIYLAENVSRGSYLVGTKKHETKTPGSHLVFFPTMTCSRGNSFQQKLK